MTQLAYDFDAAGVQLGGVKKGTIRGLVDAGKLRAIWIGRHLAIPHCELERFISEQLNTA